MSFPRYPRYKDSGVEWLGKVPEHWSLPKLKSVARFSGGGTPSRENMAYWNGDIPWVSPKDMKAERIVGAEESITEEGLRSSASNLLPPGRVLMVVRSGILKHTIPVAINETAVALNQDMKALDFDPAKCVATFFLRWVQGYNDQLLLAWAKQGATVESIEHTYLADTVLPLPDVAEQTAIAAFLDRETAKIDELVAEQRRLMELLKEKRQAVISHAVTRGLHPAAPLKPSGIEWLGDIPAHWETKRLRYAVEIDNGPRFPINRSERADMQGEYPYWGPTGILDSLNHYRYEGERVLIGEDGDHFNKYAHWPMTQWATGRYNVNNHAHVIASGRRCTARWFYFSFLHRDIGADLVAQGATRLKLTREALSNLIVVCPPIGEQQDIIEFLERELAKFDTLTAEAERAIDLLQERRTALISAAVTGQIDVRRLAEKKAA